MRWILCLVMMLGCDSGGPSCKDVVAAAKLPAALVDICKEEGWSAEARACVAKSTTDEQLYACVSIDSSAHPMMVQERDRARAKAAEQAALQAVKDAQAAKESLDKIQGELDALNSRLDEAVNAVVNAHNDADRAAAKAKLTQLQKEQYDVKQRIEAARAAASRAERSKGVHISKECMDNPLAKGCS